MVNINIVLTCLQNFQEYIITNIEQLLKLKHQNIYVLTNSFLIDNFKDYISKVNIIIIDDYDLSNTIFNTQYATKYNSFRNGFWALTSTRFFYIYEFMKKYNIENVIHLENDVLIYYNCDESIKYSFDNNYLYIPFDTFSRNIASIMYIPNNKVFKVVLDQYDHNQNDMYNFSNIQKKNRIDTKFTNIYK